MRVWDNMNMKEKEKKKNNILQERRGRQTRRHWFDYGNERKVKRNIDKCEEELTKKEKAE